MSTVIEFTFPFGRYHATPWGRTANEAEVEWPPSPWRLGRALVSVWYQRCPELPKAHLQEIIRLMSTSVDYHLPPYVLAHSRHYFPDTISGTDLVFDPFVVIDVGSRLYARFAGDLADGIRASLETLVESIPYIGRADSVCEVRLLDGEPDVEWNTTEDPAAGDSTIDLLVPGPSTTLQDLEMTSRHLRGRLRLLDPPTTRRATFRRPATCRPLVTANRAIRSEAPTALRFRLGPPPRNPSGQAVQPPMRHAVLYTDVLRRAAMSRFGRLHDGAISASITGRGPGGLPLSDAGHAHYLALPDNWGNPTGSHIATLVVWVPAGLDDDELAVLADLRALRGVEWIREFREVHVGCEGWGDLADVAPELTGISTVFESVTPFAARAHKKAHRSWEDHVERDLRRALAAAELPTPVSIEALDPLRTGFRSYRPAKERLADARPTRFYRLTFRGPVAGPLALGPLAHFGLGLFRSVD